MPADAPAFIRIGPERPASPVILSVPHAGRSYSDALLGSARLPRATLEALEDRLVDRLVWRAASAGITAFVAQAPRVEIDLNRDEREMDPSLVSPPLPSSGLLQSARTRGGLGLVPSRIGGAGAIWRQRLSREELVRRIVEVHRPYHAALAGALEAARARFGSALLLDCHSMPPRSAGGATAGIVLGDRHGTTIAADLMDAARKTAEALGFATSLNAPYAGGHIVERHGRPGTGVHALQLEIDRSLYLDADLREPGPGFEDVARLIAGLAEALEARLIGPAAAIAAE